MLLKILFTDQKLQAFELMMQQTPRGIKRGRYSKACKTPVKNLKEREDDKHDRKGVCSVEHNYQIKHKPLDGR